MARKHELVFNKDALRNLPPAPPGKRVYYRDAKDTNLHFGMAVTDTGAKTFFVQRRVAGKPVRMMLGRFPEMSVAMARKRAGELNQEIAAGGDPYKRSEPIRHGLTFAQFFEAEYLPRHARPFKRSWQQDLDLLRRHLQPIASIKLAAVTRRDVQRLHVELGESGRRRTANLALAIIHSVFQRAIEWDYFTGPNPAAGVRKFSERSRERFLQPGEAPALFAALQADAEAHGSTFWRDFFLLALMTGARCGNIKGMRWDQIDAGNAVWTIPSGSTKTGTAYRLPLSSVAMQILSGRRQEVSEACPWVFPGRVPGQPVKEIKSAWRRIQNASGLHDLRVHDLRRSLGSWQAASGASLPIIGKTLGHTNTASTHIYARLDLNPVRKSVEVANAALVKAGRMLEEEKK